MRVLILSAFMLLMGCATSKKQIAKMDSWINQPKSELLSTNGAPTRVVSDGLGGEILVYERMDVGGINGMTFSQTTFAEFYVNSSGIIYKWRRGSR